MLVETQSEKINLPQTDNLFEGRRNYLAILWRLCLPLMLSSLSSTLMIFLDRIVLAKYDTAIMVAATAASNLFFVFQFGSMSITMIAEVFVGKSNGARRFHEVGKPVWQMIWFSLGCGVLMMSIGMWGTKYLIPATFMNGGYDYFKWMMLFGISFPMVGALSAFFIGRGKVRLVTLSVILGNILNFVLVLPLVFGIPGVVSPMGAKGAAIATGIAETSVVLGLFYIFLKPVYRQKYGTNQWRFNPALFWNCLKLGFPNSVGHMIATSAWTWILYRLAERTQEHIIVMSIGLSIWMLFSFITEGLQKGVTAIAANYLGAKRESEIKKILMSGLQLQFLLAVILAIPLVLTPGLLVTFFIPTDGETTISIIRLKELVVISCRWLWLAYLFDGMAWVIDGILTAAGDTRFIMIMNSVGTWLLCTLPIYLFVIKLMGSPILTLQLIALFCFILFSCYYLRYHMKFANIDWQTSNSSSQILAQQN